MIALTETHIAELVDRGGKLAREIASAERKKAELDSIKMQLREAAGGKDATFEGKIFTATIEQKPDSVCRTVEDLLLPRVLKLAGEAFSKLFTLHPSKGSEKSFELNARKALPKRSAEKLVEMLAVRATAWVRFS